MLYGFGFGPFHQIFMRSKDGHPNRREGELRSLCLDFSLSVCLSFTFCVSLSFSVCLAFVPAFCVYTWTRHEHERPPLSSVFLRLRWLELNRLWQKHTHLLLLQAARCKRHAGRKWCEKNKEERKKERKIHWNLKKKKKSHKRVNSRSVLLYQPSISGSPFFSGKKK